MMTNTALNSIQTAAIELSQKFAACDKVDVERMWVERPQAVIWLDRNASDYRKCRAALRKAFAPKKFCDANNIGISDAEGTLVWWRITG